MYTHHTKDKGDIGLGMVVADLMSKGIRVALPLSEHLPFDCIAVSAEGQMSRVSVKYRKANKGVIALKMASVWSNAKGCHVRQYDRKEFDILAIYCPDTGACYYIRSDEVTTNSVWLRVEEPKQHQRNRPAMMATDYANPNRCFEPA